MSFLGTIKAFPGNVVSILTGSTTDDGETQTTSKTKTNLILLVKDINTDLLLVYHKDKNGENIKVNKTGWDFIKWVKRKDDIKQDCYEKLIQITGESDLEFCPISEDDINFCDQEKNNLYYYVELQITKYSEETNKIDWLKFKKNAISSNNVFVQYVDYAKKYFSPSDDTTTIKKKGPALLFEDERSGIFIPENVNENFYIPLQCIESLFSPLPSIYENDDENEIDRNNNETPPNFSKILWEKDYQNRDEVIKRFFKKFLKFESNFNFKDYDNPYEIGQDPESLQNKESYITFFSTIYKKRLMNDLLFSLPTNFERNMTNKYKTGLVDMAFEERFWKNRDPNYNHLTSNRLKKAIRSGYKNLYKNNFIEWDKKIFLIKPNSMLSVVLYHPSYKYMKVSSYLKETLCYDGEFQERSYKRSQDELYDPNNFSNNDFSKTKNKKQRLNKYGKQNGSYNNKAIPSTSNDNNNNDQLDNNSSVKNGNSKKQTTLSTSNDNNKNDQSVSNQNSFFPGPPGLLQNYIQNITSKNKKYTVYKYSFYKSDNRQGLIPIHFIEDTDFNFFAKNNTKALVITNNNSALNKEDTLDEMLDSLWSQIRNAALTLLEQDSKYEYVAFMGTIDTFGKNYSLQDANQETIDSLNQKIKNYFDGTKSTERISIDIKYDEEFIDKRKDDNQSIQPITNTKDLSSFYVQNTNVTTQDENSSLTNEFLGENKSFDEQHEESESDYEDAYEEDEQRNEEDEHRNEEISSSYTEDEIIGDNLDENNSTIKSYFDDDGKLFCKSITENELNRYQEGLIVKYKDKSGQNYKGKNNPSTDKKKASSYANQHKNCLARITEIFPQDSKMKLEFLNTYQCNRPQVESEFYCMMDWQIILCTNDIVQFVKHDNETIKEKIYYPGNIAESLKTSDRKVYYYEEKNDSKIRNGLITDIDSIIREGKINDIDNTDFIVKIETPKEEINVTFQNFFNYFCKFKDELIGKIKNFSKK